MNRREVLGGLGVGLAGLLAPGAGAAPAEGSGTLPGLQKVERWSGERWRWEQVRMFEVKVGDRIRMRMVTGEWRVTEPPATNADGTWYATGEPWENAERGLKMPGPSGAAWSRNVLNNFAGTGEPLVVAGPADPPAAPAAG